MNFWSDIKFKYPEVFFNFDNIKFKGDKNNYFFDARLCIIIKEYLSCFFDKQAEIRDLFKTKLLKALLTKNTRFALVKI